MPARQLLTEMEERLARAGCVFPAAEAERLAGLAPDEGTAWTWLARREDGEPLAWIVGTVEFCDADHRIEPGVFVPRVQSEVLARRAATLLPPGGRAVDLCTGAGVIAAHLQRAVPGASVVATDLDAQAARCARSNGVAAVVSDLGEGLTSRSFDLVTAVPPYVPSGELALLPDDVRRFEPKLALDGGGDGLAVARPLVIGAARLLRSAGWLVMEVGGDQANALESALAAAGFTSIESWADEEDDLRGVCAQIG